MEDTGSLAFNILIGFGVVGSAGGALALLESASASIVLGLILAGAGILLRTSHPKQWGLLASVLVLVGSLTTAGGIVVLTEGNPAGFLLVTALCLGAAILARSGLLITLAALALSATVGAANSYSHASYELIIRQPTLTVVLFSSLGWGGYRLSFHLGGEYARLATLFARTSVFLVNLGFWVGSLWGDQLLGGRLVIPSSVFALGWAIGLVAIGAWAVQQNRRWVVNLSAIFGAIHFYTQYFERLGASPASILVAGLAALGIAVAFVQYNKKFSARPSPPEPSLESVPVSESGSSK
jgi:iron complex transport system permease protein